MTDLEDVVAVKDNPEKLVALDRTELKDLWEEEGDPVKTASQDQPDLLDHPVHQVYRVALDLLSFLILEIQRKDLLTNTKATDIIDLKMAKPWRLNRRNQKAPFSLML